MADQFDGSGNQYPVGSFYSDLATRIDALEAVLGTAPGTVPDGSITSYKLAAGAVVTAKIADANVTSAKLAAEVISRFGPATDLTDARTRLAAVEGKLAWEKIAVVDFVAQTQVIQTDLGAYRELRITLEVVGNSTQVTMQVSANNGSSWLAGGTDYTAIGVYSQSGSTTTSGFTVTGSAFGWFANNILAGGRPSIETVTFGQFNKAAEMQGTGSASWISGSQYFTSAVSMNYAPATALNALKMSFSTAISGRLIIEGVKG